MGQSLPHRRKDTNDAIAGPFLPFDPENGPSHSGENGR